MFKDESISHSASACKVRGPWPSDGLPGQGEIGFVGLGHMGNGDGRAWRVKRLKVV
jgi:hypothetical protein